MAEVKWTIIFLHLLGNPVMSLPSEGTFATRKACMERVAILNRKEIGLWYHACVEVSA